MATVNNNDIISKARQEITSSIAYQRLALLFDDGSFTELSAFSKSSDTYAEVIAGYGVVNGCPVYAFAQNSEFALGAMSTAQGAKLKKLYDMAVKTGCPVVGFYDSSGGRLAQGVEMLDAYGTILNSISNLSGVVPQISVILGNCSGCAALNAANADIIIMSKNGRLTLDTGASNSDLDSLKTGGLVDIFAENDKQAIENVRRVISYLPSNNLSVAPMAEAAQVNDSASLDPIELTVDAGSFVQLKSDSSSAVKLGLARIYGVAVAIVATNGEKLDYKACKNTADFVSFADAFAIPVVTFANSEAFTCLSSASKLAAVYAQSTTVKVTVVTGEAYGSFYVALAGAGANADVTLAWENSSIAPLAPITGASLIWADKMSVPVSQQQAVVELFKAEMCSAFVAAEKGYVDDIIKPEDTRARVYTALGMLSGKRVSQLPKKHSTI